MNLNKLSLPANPKTAVLFGSPNNNGHTKKYLDEFLALLPPGGETEIIDAYGLRPAPCFGCGYCTENGKCKNNDLDGVFEKLSAADLAVIASPVYFYGFPAPLKAVVDRLQPLYINKFIRKGPFCENKNAGALIATSGRDDAETFEMLKRQSKIVFSLLSKELRIAFYFPETDKI
ncbi:MAG: flavodoxin family protein [Oscillospiraceae bacterium]|nr:flavodoxin family protein [Oscillospiraceae bacterium]